MTTDQPVDQAEHRRQWQLVWLATVAGIIAAFNVGKVSATVPLIRDQFSTSLSEAGLLASSYSLLAMLGSLLIGLIVARTGPYRCSHAGLLLLAIGGAGGALADSYATLLGSRIIEGAGYVCIAVAMPALISARVSASVRPLAMGLWGTFVPVGIALALLTAPTLVAVDGWQTMWWSSALLALLWLLIFASAVGPRSGATPIAASDTGALKTIFTAAPLLLAACFCLYSINFTAVTIFLPSAWSDNSVLALGSASRLTAFVAVFNIIGNLLGGWLLSRGIAFKCLLFLALIGGSLFAMPVYFQAVPVLLQAACASIAILLGGILPASIFATVRDYAVSNAQAGLIMGLVFQGAATGQVLAPWILGKLVDSSGGWHYAPVFFLSIGLLAVVLLARLPVPAAKA